jgi:hypothetical protein
MGDRRGAYEVLMGKPEGKRTLGSARSRWEDNIKRILEKLDGGVDWIDVAQDKEMWRAVVNTVMNFRFAYNAGNFLSS